MIHLIIHRPARHCLTLGTLVVIAMTSLFTGRFTSAGEWYVSPTGNDAAAGTQSHPFATLERAVEATRRQRQKTATTADHLPVATIRIQGGLHRRTAAIELGARDSSLRVVGSAEAPATLHAGRYIDRTAFQPVTDRSLLERMNAKMPGNGAQALHIDVDLFHPNAAFGVRVQALVCFGHFDRSPRPSALPPGGDSVPVGRPAPYAARRRPCAPGCKSRSPQREREREREQ